MVSCSSRSDGTKQHVDLAEDARHLERHLPSKPIGLHEVHRREEARLAEHVRPRVGDLDLQLVRALAESVSSSNDGRALGEEHGVSEPYGQSGSVTSVVCIPSFFIVSSAARSTSVAGFSSSSGGCSRPQARHGAGGVEVEVTRHARQRRRGPGPVMACSTSIASSTPPGHRAELVERPAERHGAGARHAAEGRTQAGRRRSASRGDDAAAGLAADGERHERGRRRGRAGPGARSRTPSSGSPRVHRLAAEPDVVERERAEGQLRDEHRAAVVEPAHDGRIGRGTRLRNGSAP